MFSFLFSMIIIKKLINLIMNESHAPYYSSSSSSYIRKKGYVFIFYSSEGENMLECEICCEMFERDKPAHFPKMLPCGHTMCARCIDRLISANQQITTFQCPMCKQSLSNPSHGAQLPTNYYIMGLLEENSKPASSNINANESVVCCFFFGMFIVLSLSFY